MLKALQVVTVLDLAVAMALSLAHALEYPGKLRLAKDEYYMVQRIYYPGFTYGGITELAGILLLVGLVVLLPKGNIAYWLTVVALLAAATMHAIYWLVTHPINQAWVKDMEMSGFGTGFFSFGSKTGPGKPSWTQLRDRWEYSHIARAALAFVALASLVISLVTFA